MCFQRVGSAAHFKPPVCVLRMNWALVTSAAPGSAWRRAANISLNVMLSEYVRPRTENRYHPVKRLNVPNRHSVLVRIGRDNRGRRTGARDHLRPARRRTLLSEKGRRRLNERAPYESERRDRCQTNNRDKKDAGDNGRAVRGAACAARRNVGLRGLGSSVGGG